MIWTIIPYILCVVVGFVVGLLVGRRNPAIADVAANAANQAQQQAKKL